MRATDQAAPSSPLSAALLTGTAPRTIRLSAARGVLPLPRAELVHILIVLLQDADDEVSREASRSLGSLAENEILGLLNDAAIPAEVLDHFGTTSASAPVLEAVLANSATPAETLRRLAPALAPQHVDLLLLNQMRLIDSPDLLDHIWANPAITPLQRSRVEEFRRHFLGRAPVPKPPLEVDSSPGTGGMEAPPEVADQTSPLEAPADPEITAIGHESQAAAQRIQRMNTAEKIQLAFKGTREDRAILIKDASKAVHQAVLESPKLSDNEVEAMARMRSVTEDVLRSIAANRDWMKNYTVVLGLTTNPKTPAGVAMNLVGRLNNRDLKVMAGDRNIPDLIRRQARRVVETRNEGRR